MRNVPALRSMMVVWGLIVVVVVWAAAVGPACADDPTPQEKEQLQRRSEQFKESLGWYQVFTGRDNQTPLKPESVLRWVNPTRLQRGETNLLLWTDGGRPEALASVYPWNKHLTYECISLARDAGLTAKENGQVIWSPSIPGVKFADVPEAPVPSKSATIRLTQMRAIAEPFKVTMTSMKDGLQDREEMRLLPKPIYRYNLDPARPANPDLIDGAMFAFVQGTDPEAVLMVEAIRRADKTVYQFAFGRATGWTVEAKLGASTVWSATNQPSWNDPKLTGIAKGRLLVD